jgi:nitroimidazol reductase NimA-like FMN-containing flavoprotein (pyridoxamine 5'-phosphate oxidase superfamily)
MVDIEKDEINKILARPLLARIATTSSDMYPHVVPVLFWWDGEYIYIETGFDFQKARNLYENPKCAVLIDDTQGGLHFRDIFMRGEVELITEPVEWVMEIVIKIYQKCLGTEGILAPTPQEMINSKHFIIKFAPKKIVSWDDTPSAVAPID